MELGVQPRLRRAASLKALPWPFRDFCHLRQRRCSACAGKRGACSHLTGKEEINGATCLRVLCFRSFSSQAQALLGLFLKLENQYTLCVLPKQNPTRCSPARPQRPIFTIPIFTPSLIPRACTLLLQFQDDTACLSCLERSRTKSVISIPVRDKPPMQCLASLSHTLYLPSFLLSLSWWRHSILPPLALAPLARSHHSAAGLTGSDVCQRLFFISWALEPHLPGH
ncbi:uncharacterized protein LOC127059114 [Serinus canaria]|uniref:uncharacterized protein LOC127059114 n=1 Tax=Serinus canaria TaxID=9135 RepID=UPI0021CC7F1B|nr:uncharacterized protein LOC127059114 [Serinus canaria]